jgi:hypothetical protein
MGKLQIRGDTTVNWSAANPVLANRELAVDTTLNKLKVGNGVTAWNSLGFCGGGGMWELVESWEPSAPATSHTFSGLNGNVDRKYKISIKISGSTAGGNIFALINNDTSSNNYVQRYYSNGGNAIQGGDGDNFIYVGDIGSTGYSTIADIELYAKTGTTRPFLIHSMSQSNITDMNTMYIPGYWKNAIDNITSITIYSSNNLGIVPSSYIELWKLAQ